MNELAAPSEQPAFPDHRPPQNRQLSGAPGGHARISSAARAEFEDACPIGDLPNLPLPPSNPLFPSGSHHRIYSQSRLPEGMLGPLLLLIWLPALCEIRYRRVLQLRLPQQLCLWYWHSFFDWYPQEENGNWSVPRTETSSGIRFCRAATSTKSVANQVFRGACAEYFCF